MSSEPWYSVWATSPGTLRAVSPGKYVSYEPWNTVSSEPWYSVWATSPGTLRAVSPGRVCELRALEHREQ
ncbi:hypothetical protein chiPu_0002857 [Chiloscyllium punctatum]|uniref:Uncharacterized protein n=1 Tax=Chiloscyllium punctatum TaxID=137246 RepID=A0A401S272_CHIPU|nr:hypothetical protein [Chiloscyllium punctatum]